MPVISGSCCGTVWYCTPAGPVEVAVGTAPPAGYVSGPFMTEAELGTCGFTLPAACDGCPPVLVNKTLYLNFSDKTGVLTCLPNSVPILYNQPGYNFIWSTENTVASKQWCGPDFGDNYAMLMFVRPPLVTSGTGTCLVRLLMQKNGFGLDGNSYAFRNVGVSTCGFSDTFHAYKDGCSENPFPIDFGTFEVCSYHPSRLPYGLNGTARAIVSL